MKQERTFTEEKAQLAKKLWLEDKLPRSQVAKRFGVSPTTISDWMRRIGALPPKGTSKPDKPAKTKSQQLVDWLKDNPKGKPKEFKKQTRVSISDSQFYTIRKQTCGGAYEMKPREPTKIIAETTTIHKLKQENDFLRWWMNGERQGWVDLLLVELKK